LKRSLTFWPLALSTYFMVSGGPFGLEDLIGSAGYGAAFGFIVLTPMLWSVPTALMVGELASALPEAGGYYAWVRRALTPFWGFQEAWLSFAAAVFDLAIYPTLFASYLGRLVPWAQEHPTLTALIALLFAAGINLRGARSVGRSSVLFFLLVLSPFVVLAALALFASPAVLIATPAAVPKTDLFAALTIAMWNYTGWDNASTVAQEVENPARTYPRAVLAAVGLVVLSYLIPTGSALLLGIAREQCSTGGWVDIARIAGAPKVATAIAISGTLSPLAMLAALLLSYAELPPVLARDGFLPALFTKRPAAVLFVAALALASLGFSFKRLVVFDMALFGLSLMLEFAALYTLRKREPELVRPFRVPGGNFGALLLGLPPACMVALSLFAARDERFYRVPALAVIVGVVLLGPLLYRLRRQRT
jgi:amino acid transporter